MNKKQTIGIVIAAVVSAAVVTTGGIGISKYISHRKTECRMRNFESSVREKFKNFCEGDTAAKIKGLHDNHYMKKNFNAVGEFTKNTDTKKLVGKRAEDDHWEFEIVNSQDKKLGKDDKSASRKENWEAVGQFMEEAEKLICDLQDSLKKPVGTNRNKNIFYEFYEKFDRKIPSLGDEYSYIKNSYKAVKEFYAFSNVKKLIKVSVPGEDGKHHHWEFKAVDRCSSNDDSQLTDWQAVESFMYIAESLLSFRLKDELKLERYVSGYLPKNLKEKFKHIEDSLEAAKGFVKDPKSKCLVRISKKDKKGVHDHWEFILIDRGSDLSKLDGDEQLLMLDWYALDCFINLIEQTSEFADGCNDWKKGNLGNILGRSNILVRLPGIDVSKYDYDAQVEKVEKFLKDPKNKTLIQTTSDEGGKQHRVFKTIDRKDFSQNQSFDATDFEAVENYVNAVAGYSTVL